MTGGPAPIPLGPTTCHGPLARIAALLATLVVVTFGAYGPRRGLPEAERGASTASPDRSTSTSRRLRPAKGL